ncbi:hypothetical protein BFP97_16855 [Roseivirga sp. 4D4]|uniref:AAA family ATPase n=1 Tax=Roseivirga sp. 4D4 TaxID=1889784 RepID=UPI000853065B|nr:AAA family ATPase [Roseivirga sp. 4D4]OEK03088.1 hypothetical protein BFP97_16855 [Roseivirga sp. 4D4]
MIIDEIKLRNYRIYYGDNKLKLRTHSNKNISIVSGNNGYGKTSLLTSLVWCLYGKLMIDVDDRYRREIYEAGGYKKYCQKTLNRKAWSEKDKHHEQLMLDFKQAEGHEKIEIGERLKGLTEFSVSIVISDIFIPSILCQHVEITRSYDVSTHQEKMEILIDGRENELTRQVGSDIFINDFVLPKEIAKFFFFDAEKIVSLADIHSIEDKRNLSKAYAEVLGIKKYVDLKSNLENVRARLRKKVASPEDKAKLRALSKDVEKNRKLIEICDTRIFELEESITQNKSHSERYQEKLIREGSAMTVEDLKDLRSMKDHLSEEGRRIKQQLKELIDLAPFAIAAKKLKQVKIQAEQEDLQRQQGLSKSFIETKLSAFEAALGAQRSELGLSEKGEQLVTELMRDQFEISQTSGEKPLLDFDRNGQNRFYAVFDNLSNAYSKAFRKLSRDLKKQQSAFSMIVNKLSNAESKEKDPVIVAYRRNKTRLDRTIHKEENELITEKAKRISLHNELSNHAKVLAELEKNIQVEELDREKDLVAERLVKELEDFIATLKAKKKDSLEERLQSELNRLMHKADFVKRVEVIIDGDLIEIELYSPSDKLIPKDSLSMGERQLYATALLKALVDESNVKFPLFIDSPLQKFDRGHAENVIREFYPEVSDQVVLFPLLEGELSEKEYDWLKPNTSHAYLIDNVNLDQSRFLEILPNDLFTKYNQMHANVH